MKKKGNTAAAVCALLAVLLAVGSVGCGSRPVSGESTAVTRESVTGVVAPEPDTRSLTDTSAYEERLSNDFSGMPAATSAELVYTSDADGVTVTGYTGDMTVLIIPSELDGMPVIGIGAGAFRGLPIRALCLPDTLKHMGTGALEKCRELVTLRTPVVSSDGCDWFGSLFGAGSYAANASAVPARLTTLILTDGAGVIDIPDYCFYGCTGLETVGLPAGVNTVGAFAFYGAESLAFITLPENLKQVGSYAFANCSALLSLNLSAGVSSMGAHMLEGCARLESLTLPFVGESADKPGTAYLGYLFGAESYTLTEGFLPFSLQRVALLPGCAEVPDNAFYECSRLREIYVPDTVTSIGSRAFYRCAYLTDMTLPGGLTSLGDEAFSGCLRLGAVDLSMLDSTEDWGIQSFYGCVSLKQARLSEKLTGQLPSGTFAGCTALDELEAPVSLEMTESAFRGCPVYRQAMMTETTPET